MVPGNTPITCRCGTDGSFINYVIVSQRARHLVRRLSASELVPWTTHCMLSLEVNAKPNTAMYLQLQLPKPFSHPPKPATAPDPHSKRQRRIQEAQLKLEAAKAKLNAEPEPKAKRCLRRKTQEADTEAENARRQGKAPDHIMAANPEFDASLASLAEETFDDQGHGLGPCQAPEPEHDCDEDMSNP